MAAFLVEAALSTIKAVLVGGAPPFSPRGLGHIISYHIISYHIVSYHTMSYHIISYHIISYHIMSYHIISYHIISYHIISYHIISYHIISYHIMSYHTRTRDSVPQVRDKQTFGDFVARIRVKFRCELIPQFTKAWKMKTADEQGGYKHRRSSDTANERP